MLPATSFETWSRSGKFLRISKFLTRFLKSDESPYFQKWTKRKNLSLHLRYNTNVRCHLTLRSAREQIPQNSSIHRFCASHHLHPFVVVQGKFDHCKLNLRIFLFWKAFVLLSLLNPVLYVQWIFFFKPNANDPLLRDTLFTLAKVLIHAATDDFKQKWSVKHENLLYS